MVYLLIYISVCVGFVAFLLGYVTGFDHGWRGRV